MYDMDISVLKKGRGYYLFAFIFYFSIMLLILYPVFEVFFSEDKALALKEFLDDDFSTVAAVLMYISISIITPFWFYYAKTRKYLIAKKLNQTGKLVKNVPYKLENTGKLKWGHMVLRPVVEWTLPNGEKIELHGHDRDDLKDRDKDGLIDMVIDENDPTKCFMDFEINRLSGNLDSDYYMGNKNPEPVEKIEKVLDNIGFEDKLPKEYYENYEDKKEE